MKQQTDFIPVISQNFEIYHFSPTNQYHDWLKKHNESAENFTRFSTLFQLHSHDVIEIIVILNGECEFFCEGKVYSLKSGDVVVIPAYAVHRVIPKDPKTYERVVVKVNPHLMLDFELSEPKMKKDIVYQKSHGPLLFHPQPKSFADIVSLLFKIVNKIKNGQEDYSFTLHYSLFQVLQIIFHPSSSIPELKKNEIDERLASILEYIETHLTENGLNLDNIASHFHLNKYYFSHYFKKKMNVSFYRYVSLKRLSLAMTKIKQNQDSIENIALQCGFIDYSSFYRLFKKEYQLSPKNLQKQYSM